jgi:hypothetical protein
MCHVSTCGTGFSFLVCRLQGTTRESLCVICARAVPAYRFSFVDCKAQPGNRFASYAHVRYPPIVSRLSIARHNPGIALRHMRTCGTRLSYLVCRLQGTSVGITLRHVRTCGCQVGGKSLSNASRRGLTTRLGAFKASRNKEAIL